MSSPPSLPACLLPFQASPRVAPLRSPLTWRYLAARGREVILRGAIMERGAPSPRPVPSPLQYQSLSPLTGSISSSFLHLLPPPPPPSSSQVRKRVLLCPTLYHTCSTHTSSTCVTPVLHSSDDHTFTCGATRDTLLCRVCSTLVWHFVYICPTPATPMSHNYVLNSRHLTCGNTVLQRTNIYYFCCTPVLQLLHYSHPSPQTTPV